MPLLANLTFAAILGSGLLAGTFFAFSTFVLAGLRDLAPEAGMAAMRRINARATRSPFVVLFLGIALIALYLLGQAWLNWGRIGMAYLLNGAVATLVGTFGITVVGNVPLNRWLDAMPDDPRVWARYVRRWSLWNHVRTLAALFALWNFAMSLVDQRVGLAVSIRL